MATEQLRLQWGTVRNSALFSNHWLENRLPLEPEWTELRSQAKEILDNLAELWRVQKDRVALYGDEQGLEEAFIQPVLRELGWVIKYQAYLRNREPDYALFLDNALLDAALRVGRTSSEFWDYPTIVADAKAWHISLDRPIRVNNKREYPPEQIEWYLDRSRLDYGILTNGKIWRLIPREYDPQQRRFQTYLECDLESLLNSWIAIPNLTQQSALLDEFLQFYLFFSPAGFVEAYGRKPLITRALEGSSEYRLGIGEGLKDRTFEALRLCIEGFLAYPENGLDAVADLKLCREQSFVLLYRLLFIMYAEDRRLLPYRINRPYTNNRSLSRFRDEIAGNLDRARNQREYDFSRQSTDIWLDLQDLFDIVDKGRRIYGVHPYNGGLFDTDAYPILVEKRISDWYLARVIDQLSRAPDPERPIAGLFRVDYHDLAIQHLGGIYEGLLELHPYQATETMIVVSRRIQNKLEEIVQPASQAIPRGYQATAISYPPGTIYLQTNKGERRATGSYYTPDHIVDHIIEKTLGPICTAISNELNEDIITTQQEYERAAGAEREQIAQKLESLRRDYDDRILRLRILDPAMGSGHFLLRTCQYLGEEIATHPYTGDELSANDSSNESSLTYWKRQVAEHCLYGVDMNGLAVELAKLVECTLEMRQVD